VKAFVTGITGFAGTHLAEHLLNCGDEVLGCSRSGAWKREAPAQLTTGVKLLAWDVAAAASPEVVGQLQRFRPDVIYHLAAISVPDACGTDEPNDQALAVNVEGTRGCCWSARGTSMGERSRRRPWPKTRRCARTPPMG
jgi:GDP-4-dehydro-6-deoxy-D-mannose reductase